LTRSLKTVPGSFSRTFTRRLHERRAAVCASPGR
jgi:hypothetical protein